MIKKSDYFTEKKELINEKDVRALLSGLSPEQKESFSAYVQSLAHFPLDAK